MVRSDLDLRRLKQKSNALASMFFKQQSIFHSRKIICSHPQEENYLQPSTTKELRDRKSWSNFQEWG